MIVLAVVAAVLLMVLRLSDILPIITVAVILSYLLTPMVNFIDEKLLIFPPFGKRSHRNLAVVFTYIVIIAGFVIIILVVVPALVAQLEEFGRRLPSLLRTIESSVEHTLSEPLTFNGEPILINGEPFVPLERLQEATGSQHVTDFLQLENINLVGTTQSFVGSLTGSAFSFVGGALTAIINVIFLLVMMFFFLRDGAIFVEKGLHLTPQLYRGDAKRLLYELGQVWNAYLRGQFWLALFMGLAAFISAVLLGIPNPLILGMISALLEFIPGLGSGLAIFPAALLALTSQSITMPGLEGVPFAIIVVIVWALLQNIEAYFLVPRIMGGSLNLHPLTVVIAIIAGASLAGVLGIILAAPTVASLRIFGQYIYGKLTDHDPFPHHPVSEPIVNANGLRRIVRLAHLEFEARLIAQIRARLEAMRKHNHVG
jgi:predicted PurR-regulated permease PerM